MKKKSTKEEKLREEFEKEFCEELEFRRKFGRGSYFSDLWKWIEKALAEERQKVMVEIAKLDFIDILSEAIKARPTSWGKDVVSEWRNASDEVWGAMYRQAVKNGIWEDFFEELKHK